jgi:hypothetical protein
MTTRKIEEITIYESPDGGKTVYARKVLPGESSVLPIRKFHSVDASYKKEQQLTERWVNLREAVWMADSDTTMNDAIMKVELLYVLKKDNK